MANETSINPHPHTFLRHMREAAYHGIGNMAIGVWEGNFWTDLMLAANRAGVPGYVYVRILTNHPHFESVREELSAVLGGDTFEGLVCSSQELFIQSLLSSGGLKGRGEDCRGLYVA